MNVNLKKIVEILNFLKINNNKMEKMLIDISSFAKDQIIDFGLLERGLRKRLLKKGDKKKNIEEYFGKVLNSLKYRERGGYGTEPESEDYEFEVEEPSIVPKKIYRKELYDLQVELLKLQEWLTKTGKTVIIAFEGRDSAGKGTTIKKFTENDATDINDFDDIIHELNNDEKVNYKGPYVFDSIKQQNILIPENMYADIINFIKEKLDEDKIVYF
jgi:hypothetical protein